VHDYEVIHIFNSASDTVCLSVNRISQKVIDGFLNQILWNDRPLVEDQSVRFWDWTSDLRSIFPLFQHWEL